MQNARTFDEQQRRLREAEALLGVADSLAHTRDIGEIMRRVCREAARALGADSAVFYIVDEQTGHVVPAAGYHIPKGALSDVRPLRVDEIPQALRDTPNVRQILFVPDLKADPRCDMPAFKAVGARALLVSPIIVQDRFVGDVLLFWRDVHRVSEADLALMAAISAQAALALENTRLLVETQSAATALREKNAELDSFVYTVSHDLKAPLVTIQGMSGMVLEEFADKLDDDGRHYLQRIVANTQQMERLILDGKKSIDVKQEAYWRYNKLVDERNWTKVWADPRAQSYYWTHSGRTATQNPFGAPEMWHFLRKPDLDDMKVD